eukprot:m.196584 g.196584  ORF g.196584 m.196584 type:complete len:469 (-) comp15465_c2_seq5:25-1431(-)
MAQYRWRRREEGGFSSNAPVRNPFEGIQDGPDGKYGVGETVQVLERTSAVLQQAEAMLAGSSSSTAPRTAAAPAWPYERDARHSGFAAGTGAPDRQAVASSQSHQNYSSSNNGNSDYHQQQQPPRTAAPSTKAAAAWTDQRPAMSTPTYHAPAPATTITPSDLFSPSIATYAPGPAGSSTTHMAVPTLPLDSPFAHLATDAVSLRLLAGALPTAQAPDPVQTVLGNLRMAADAVLARAAVADRADPAVSMKLRHELVRHKQQQRVLHAEARKAAREEERAQAEAAREREKRSAEQKQMEAMLAEQLRATQQARVRREHDESMRRAAVERVRRAAAADAQRALDQLSAPARALAPAPARAPAPGVNRAGVGVIAEVSESETDAAAPPRPPRTLVAGLPAVTSSSDADATRVAAMDDLYDTPATIPTSTTVGPALGPDSSTVLDYEDAVDAIATGQPPPLPPKGPLIFML